MSKLGFRFIRGDDNNGRTLMSFFDYRSSRREQEEQLRGGGPRWAGSLTQKRQEEDATPTEGLEYSPYPVAHKGPFYFQKKRRFPRKLKPRRTWRATSDAWRGPLAHPVAARRRFSRGGLVESRRRHVLPWFYRTREMNCQLLP
jgi:hypothetical protein